MSPIPLIPLAILVITDKGEIKSSEFIESPATLGINENMKIKVVSQHQDYLAYHREVVFEKKNIQ